MIIAATAPVWLHIDLSLNGILHFFWEWVIFRGLIVGGIVTSVRWVIVSISKRTQYDYVLFWHHYHHIRLQRHEATSVAECLDGMCAYIDTPPGRPWYYRRLKQ